MNKTGHNSALAIINGRLYSAHGDSSSHSYHTSGRGTDTNDGALFGIHKFRTVPLPTDSPIKTVIGSNFCRAGVLFENGDLWMWGKNINGQCGNGTTSAIDIPELVATNVVQIYDHPSCNEYNGDHGFTVILKSDGYLYSTGYNGNGQLGIGSTTSQSSFTQMSNITAGTVKNVWPMGTTFGATVVQLNDNTLLVCGDNNQGALGDGTTTDITTPTDLTSAWLPGSPTDYEVKYIGYSGRRFDGTTDNAAHTMIIFAEDSLGNQSIKACGFNTYGSLGDTTTTQRTTPVTPTGIPTSGIVDFAASGGILTCRLLKDNGDLWAWGYNGVGQCGDGTTTAKSTPALVESNVARILDYGHNSYRNSWYVTNYIQKTDGYYYAVGEGNYHYIGIGDSTSDQTSYTKMELYLEDGEEIEQMGTMFTDGYLGVKYFYTNYGNLYAWGSGSNSGLTGGDASGNAQIPHLVRLTVSNTTPGI
jgi:alpha-tubulin suppressor-like RCC1 family protein